LLNLIQNSNGRSDHAQNFDKNKTQHKNNKDMPETNNAGIYEDNKDVVWTLMPWWQQWLPITKYSRSCHKHHDLGIDGIFIYDSHHHIWVSKQSLKTCQNNLVEFLDFIDSLMHVVDVEQKVCNKLFLS